MSLLYWLMALHALFRTGLAGYGYAGHYGLPPRILPEAVEQQHSDMPPVFRTPTAPTLLTEPSSSSLSSSADVRDETTTQTRRTEDLSPTTPIPATTTRRTTTTTTKTSRGVSSNAISGSSGSSSSGSSSSGSGSSGSSSLSGNIVGNVFSFLGEPVTTKRPKPVKPGNFDKQFDGLIVNLAKALRTNGFDPIRIGNLQQCTNCTMEGLSLIRRSGPSNLIYVNRTITVDAHITIPALYISCFPCIDVILMVPLSGMLEIAIWGLEIYGKVSQKISKGENPSLITYEVLNEGDLDIRLNGHGLFGPLTEFGFKIIRQRQVSDIIREFIYERVPKFIRRRLKGFSFPIGK